MAIAGLVGIALIAFLGSIVCGFITCAVMVVKIIYFIFQYHNINSKMSKQIITLFKSNKRLWKSKLSISMSDIRLKVHFF